MLIRNRNVEDRKDKRINRYGKDINIVDDVINKIHVNFFI